MQDSQERSVRFKEVEAAKRTADVPKSGDLLADLSQYRKTSHRSPEENRRRGDCDVWILQSAYRQVLDHLTHDTSREHGGLLLGYEIDTKDKQPVVVVAHSLPANHTKGSPVRLEIQEDSWAEWDRISDSYARDYGWRRIGWYHSHPGIKIFLSRWDLDVCRDWERPTHVAMVVDPVGNQGGFFVRGEEGFRSDSPQSFVEIHNVTSRSLVTWSNVESQSVPGNTRNLQSTPPPEPEEVSAETAGLGPARPEPLPRRDRIWVYVTIVALLVLLLAANFAVLALVSRIPQETVNLQPLTDQIGELRAEVMRLRPTALVVTPPKSAPPNPLQAEAAAPPKQLSNPPGASKLAIAKKPTILKPSETFQFKVNGSPPPEVVWSLEGPGSIDSTYGMYRAPSQFSGEAKVRVTATSRTDAQSVTFTVKGSSKEEGKNAAEASDAKQPDVKKPATEAQ